MTASNSKRSAAAKKAARTRKLRAAGRKARESLTGWAQTESRLPRLCSDSKRWEIVETSAGFRTFSRVRAGRISSSCVNRSSS
jgi:hypothetical protein